MSGSVLRAAKTAYAQSMLGAGRLATRIGLLRDPTPDHRRSRGAHWRRSLFAIHNIDRLVALDVPWWTYGAICAVEDFLADRPAACVFEYGSGASTVWLARRAAAVKSIEHDAAWWRIVRSKLDSIGSLAAVDLSLVEPDEERPEQGYGSGKPGAEDLGFSAYARSIDAVKGQFDLIVVDGRARNACLRHAEARVAPGGLIVFDNANRARYREALRASNLKKQRFRGLAPCLPYPEETVLLFAPPQRGT